MSDSLPLPLLVWLSPGFPVGAFTYSHGLEWAVEAGAIRDARSLGTWLADLIAQGSIRADAILLAEAWRAVRAEDMPDACGLNALALALAPSRERHLETSAQGNAFVAAVRAAWPAPALELFMAGLARDDLASDNLAERSLAESDVAYPIAVGVAAAAHAVPLRPALEAFALACCTNLVSAAVRLGPIGQTEAQAIIASLCPAVVQLAHDSLMSGREDVGTAAWGADIASMRHETQYSRLFRS